MRGSAFLDHCAQAFDEKMEVEDSGADLKQDVIDGWFKIDPKTRNEINLRWLPCPDPLNTTFCSEQMFGTVSERVEQMIQKYVTENPDNLLLESDSISPLLPEIGHHSRTRTFEPMSKSDFFTTYCLRHMRSMCEPGEAVGVLVAIRLVSPPLR